MIIAISGVPGTGKTTLSSYLSSKLHTTHINGTALLKKMPKKWDKVRDCYIISIPQFKKTILAQIKSAKKKGAEHIIIDSHLSHELSPKNVDFVLVTTCTLPILKKRLEKRKYSAAKIRENMDAQIFDTCYIEAIEKGHIVKKIETPFKKTKILELIHQLQHPRKL